MNNANINVDSIPQHLFFRFNNLNREKYKTNKPQKKICLYDDACKHYMKINQNIRKINNYKNYYHVYEKSEFIDLAQIDESYIHKIKSPILTKQQYILLTYMDIKIESFSHFLFKNNSAKHFIFHLQNSYSFILKSLHELQKKEICFFNICALNILFDYNTEIPILQNFRSSFLMNSDLNIKKFIPIIENLNNFSHQPLETHLIYFLWKNDCKSLSYFQLEEISMNYMKSMPIFSLFSDSEREKYRRSCIEFMKMYINKETNEIIDKILIEYSKTWDNFALSILYLYFLKNMIYVFQLQEDNFLNGWSTILLKNLDPDPIKRETLENTRILFEELFEQYPNWLFVTSISPGKMNDLIKVLGC
jgi:hypothetical protein